MDGMATTAGQMFSALRTGRPSSIWRALTRSDLIAEWLMQNDFVAAEGHHFTFRAKPMPGWSSLANCVVLKIDAPRLLCYSWGDGSEPDSGL